MALFKLLSLRKRKAKVADDEQFNDPISDTKKSQKVQLNKDGLFHLNYIPMTSITQIGFRSDTRRLALISNLHYSRQLRKVS